MYDFIRDLTLYNFVRGPLVWIAFLVFIGGSIYRIRGMVLLAKKEKVVFPYMNLKHSLRSLLHWVIPFASVNWRRRPVITTITFLFHIGLVILPIFLLAHNVLIYESWGINWWTVSEGLADIMTIIVIGCCMFFLLRRIFAPEVRFVTSADDYLLLAIAFLPFLSGFLAYHQWLLPHKIMVILHMIFGSLMLIAIPFTRLTHIVYFFLTRAYMGSDQGFRHSKDW
ncbi:MAG: respiratory nitrate reductase subunit gamma [Thermodesulfovibrionales bacterium]|nr:respiratory nitrate reductase subunit gamma [Thermodesulfovibrionales bacterium]